MALLDQVVGSRFGRADIIDKKIIQRPRSDWFWTGLTGGLRPLPASMFYPAVNSRRDKGMSQRSAF
jgi:hypothetical protein